MTYNELTAEELIGPEEMRVVVGGASKIEYIIALAVNASSTGQEHTDVDLAANITGGLEHAAGKIGGP